MQFNILIVSLSVEGVVVQVVDVRLSISFTGLFPLDQNSSRLKHNLGIPVFSSLREEVT